MVTAAVCGMMLTPMVTAVRAVFHLVDRQRDAVERDRSLGRDERRDLGPGLDPHAVRSAFLDHRFDRADPVDMGR